MSSRTLFRQFSRFAVVGVISNAMLYGGYLFLTRSGVSPKIAMTLLYAVGVVQTFVVQRRWTFGSRATSGASFARYSLSYALGYLVNLLTLHLLVDIHGFPHQAVQALAVIEVAVILFLLQKFWVFRPVHHSPMRPR